MKNLPLSWLTSVALILVFLAVPLGSENSAQQAEAESPPVAYAWGHQLTVYYPARKKVYVYSELGGNCVFAYTLSTPGGPITRENCK